MSSLFAGEFRKDVIRSVFVAIVVASVLASLVAYAADMYFGDTVSGLIGEYGEYDLVLMVREDVADVAMQQISEIVRERYPGVRVKKSIAISGRTNILVGLPPSMRNSRDIQEFPVQFVSVPGYSGYGVMIEPRVEITGIESKAVREMLLQRCEEVEGVLFAFEHHGNVAVVFRDHSVVEQATETVSQILESYTLVDVRFPISGQVDDLRSAEAGLTEAIVRRFGPRKVVSSSEVKDEELGDLTKALAEMKRFLTYYATTIDIEPTERPLAIGEHVILRQLDGSETDLDNGPDETVAMVVSLEEHGYKAVVTQGEAADQAEFAVYEMMGTSSGSWLGRARSNSELKRLTHSLDSGIELLGGLTTAADEIRDSARSAKELLSDYGYLIASLTQVRQNLQKIESLVGSAGAGFLQGSGARELASALRGAKALIDRFKTGLDTVSSVASAMPAEELTATEFKRVTDALLSWQDSLSGYGDGIEAITSILQDSEQADEFISKLTDMTDSALKALYGLDVEQFSTRLDGLISTIDSIREVDTSAIHSQLLHIRESLPSLQEQEVGRSIRLIDSYLGGQVIPGDRIQLVISGRLPADAVRAVADAQFKGLRPVTAVSSLGSIQPGVRTQVLRVLGEVRSTIAALAALVFTVLILLFDHTGIISLLKKMDAGRCVAGEKRVRMAPVYAAAMGAIILSAIMGVSNASIPFVGQWLVFLIGGAIGLCVSAVAEKVSPVDSEEVMAGVAMGLPWHRIMRDIVIPSGRPGFLNALNRSEVSF